MRGGSWTVPGERRGRMRFGRILLVLGLLAAMGKLAMLQTIQAPELQRASARQSTAEVTIPAERGDILDAHGRRLAFSDEMRSLSARPRAMATSYREAGLSQQQVRQKKLEIVDYLAGKLGAAVQRDELRSDLLSQRTFVYIAKAVEPAVAREITEKYPMIAAEYRAARRYPAGTVAANIVGAANWRADQRRIGGLVGLENSMDAVLSGTDGHKIVSTAQGSDVEIPGSQRATTPAVPGSDVALTVDSDLQYNVHQMLRDYVAKSGAKSGSAVVMDAETGEVMALTNDVSFDPAQIGSAPADALNNTAVTTPYEPGSIGKALTFAAALDQGLITPEEVIQVPGRLKVADTTINDAWSHGTLNLTTTGIIAKSSNIGTLKIAQRVGEKKFADYLDRFGLGERTGVGLPGESPGYVPPRSQWSGTTFANLPIGQGMSMTVLQMAGIYQTIANDGLRVPPRIVKSTIGPDGQRSSPPRPDGVRVMSTTAAQTLRSMLVAVTQDANGEHGTAPEADLAGYNVAGKTGTAQQIDPTCGCYSHSKFWKTFAGMLPAEDPRYVVGIELDAPHGTEFSHSAAPLFHDISSYLAQRYRVPLSGPQAPPATLEK